ncbi:MULTISPECIES: bifunctional diguanylate cyclase/phosphodiesterase [unclassified Rhizobium]|uniref:putative bifunctional diguanylate cyclase/phosphodiesterase n=1 Tax=Rhizobium/Agrobacterium group TaxID=227290 RepID=UPI0008A79A44|nr:EAL domain-containing protein [Rhizobium sp. NFR12]MBD8662638.1 EAL domain-containing protein [Rhizobium sp. CFBP 8752]NSY17656.1 EAL domain-containing protein [Neorhizobium sp. AL 9.2.2]RYE69495.1 MAG: EAL domain-containing protein [Rhizobiaceae bacterium]SEH22445.1 PAS domain S-box-containing protein/diguanylate cyclase (GGDEF) domain-containing protein [Rhizobium sp. NFR12]
MAHSVESRFIAIISGALLAVVVPLFTLLLALSSQQAVRALEEHVDIVLATNSQALAKPLWDLDTESVHQIAVAMVKDPTIYAVRVTDTTGKLNISEVTPQEISLSDLTIRSQPITYMSNYGARVVGKVSVSIPTIGWFSKLHEFEFAFISIFIIAILTVFGAAILGNRVMVIKPLLRLTAAIEATRRLGSRHHVDWRSTDEMGRLAKSFNEMQTLLEHEERELKLAHRKTTQTYNLTPAMLFSLDADDRIAAVSDYWLVATGYSRSDILNLPFCELVMPEDRSLYHNRKSQVRSRGPAFEVTVRFICQSGKTMNVLIAETELGSAGDGETGSLSVMTDVTELKQSEIRNYQQAISDHLTGLLNRQGFEAALEQKIIEADRNGTDIACLFVDLDRFKSINDNLGHAAGDLVLGQFVERMLPLLGDHDAASRLGGDEFAILLCGEGSERRGTELCQRIVEFFDVPFRIETNSVRLSASIGLAFYPAHAASGAELLQKSDLAMYARKRDGKNGAQVYNSAILDKTRERAEIETDIEAALAANWFEAHLQPIVDIRTGACNGFEALMRMRHPRKGLVPPGAIVSVAEETGTIGQIGNLILEDAVANLARISRIPGMSDTYVAVNVSPLQFDASLPVKLSTLLGRYAIRPSRLVIEITEAVLMHDNPEIRRLLDEIRNIGCRIALDDFGTGYSSLSYLSRFPVDIVKIDQSFIRSLNNGDDDIDRRNKMLIEGIAAISHKMNCHVVAEGVETEYQRSTLIDMGIEYAQGYYFARPQAIGDVLTMLNADRSGDRIDSIAS